MSALHIWAAYITNRRELCNAPIINFLNESIFEATILGHLNVLRLVSEVSALCDASSVEAK